MVTATALEPEAPQDPGGLQLVYDDDCPVCTMIAESIRRRDRLGNITLARRSEAAQLLGSRGVTPEAAEREVHLLLPDGRTLTGLRVVPVLAAALPRWRRVAPLLRIWPFSHLLVVAWLLLKQLRHEM